jgi:hypothetical protein
MYPIYVCTVFEHMEDGELTTLNNEQELNAFLEEHITQAPLPTPQVIGRIKRNTTATFIDYDDLLYCFHPDAATCSAKATRKWFVGIADNY